MYEELLKYLMTWFKREQIHFEVLTRKAKFNDFVLHLKIFNPNLLYPQSSSPVCSHEK